MRNVRVVLTDLDGTILFPNDYFTEATQNAIHEMTQQGIAVVPVTGRSYRSTFELCRKIGFKGLGIFNGGSTIIDILTGEVLWEQPIDMQTAKDVIKRISPLCDRLSFGYPGPSVQENTVSETNKLKYLSIWAELKDKNLDIVLRILEQYNDLVVYASSMIKDEIIGIQLNHSQANKQFGTNKLLELLEIGKIEALAIGNDNNDIPLFKAVGTSVAMGNAPVELREIAAFTTSSLNRDGFEVAMNRYALGKKGYVS